LIDFYKDYFPFPLYKNEELDWYKAFGDGSIFDHVSYNPFRLWQGIKSMRSLGKRLKDKKIEQNLIGEGLKTGGVIIFGTDGQPQYMYPEVTGTPMDEEVFMTAVKAVRNMEFAEQEI
jgi:hypothetical protein